MVEEDTHDNFHSQSVHTTVAHSASGNCLYRPSSSVHDEGVQRTGLKLVPGLLASLNEGSM